MKTVGSSITAVGIAALLSVLSIPQKTSAQIDYVEASGGNQVYVIVQNGIPYWVHKFTTDGTATLTITEGGEVEYLIVGGGGGTASVGTAGSLEDYPYSRPGGAGAGAVIPGTQTLAAASYTIKVGKGGTTGAYANSGWGNGNPSDAFGVEALGGGRGGGYLSTHDASTGPASGGGGGSTSNRVTLPGDGVVDLGHAGGTAFTNGVYWAAGGGGGAGGPGSNAYLVGSTIYGGAGGPGVAHDIDGTLRWYGGGGGGASKGGVAGAGGSGVGGAGCGSSANLNWVQVDTANRNRGSGIGGARNDDRSSVTASGVVIVRYKIDPDLPLIIVEPFTISNIETGCTEFTNTNKVDVSNLPDPIEIEGVEYDLYQITDNSDRASIDPNEWKAFGEPLAQETFTQPVADGTVTLYAWYTNATDTVPVQRASGEIVYTLIAPPDPVMVETVTRITAGYTVRVTAESLDAGSTSGEYEGQPIGIYRRFAVDPAGESNNLTPETTYFTVDGVGTYPVRLKIVNMAGNVTTSSVSRTLNVVSTSDLPVGESGDMFVAAGNLNADPGPDPTYSNWTNAAATIQDAIAAASSESLTTIWVAPEVYYGGGEWHLSGGLANVADITKPIYLRGAADRNEVFIDGYDLRRGVRIANAGAVVEGLTVTNGYDISGGGGGVHITVTGGTLRDCVVAGNRASGSGGGIYAIGPNTLVENCDIIGNSSSADAGGGIYIANRALVTDCLIAWNSGGGSGGGIRVDGSSLGETLVLNSRILYNTASAASGGGIFLRSGGSDLPVIARNCLIMGNSPNGVALSTYAYNQAIENSTIVHNSGSSLNKTWWGGTNQIVNTIIFHNGTDTPSISGGGIYFTNSCINVANIAGLNGSGNINDDPMFVSLSDGNYRLRPGSPAINTGTNMTWMIGAVDLGGQQRIDNVSGLVDMGAYEYAPRGTMILIK